MISHEARSDFRHRGTSTIVYIHLFGYLVVTKTCFYFEILDFPEPCLDILQESSASAKTSQVNTVEETPAFVLLFRSSS